MIRGRGNERDIVLTCTAEQDSQEGKVHNDGKVRKSALIPPYPYSTEILDEMTLGGTGGSLRVKSPKQS